MEVIRVCLNSSNEQIRIDTVRMVPKRSRVTLITKNVAPVFHRKLDTTLLYGPADRTVASFECYGDFTAVDGTNYDYATWTTPSVRVDMSDLPDVGDDV